MFDRPNGKETLADLFGGKSQLIMYHFMLGPGWEAGCPSCSLLADHFDGAVVHLAQRDVAFLVVSRAPLAQIEAFKRRMGWKFKWVSSFGNDFNYDYHVSFTPEQKANGGVTYNYQDNTEFPSEERARRQRVLQRCRRRYLTYLFKLRPRSRYPGRRIQLSRSRPEGPRRRRLGVVDGVGSPPRPL